MNDRSRALENARALFVSVQAVVSDPMLAESLADGIAELTAVIVDDAKRAAYVDSLPPIDVERFVRDFCGAQTMSVVS